MTRPPDPGRRRGPGRAAGASPYTFRMTTPHIRIYTSDACSFCVRAKNLLTKKGVAYEEVHLAPTDFRARQNLVDLTGRYTVPQILIDDTPVGGYDDIKALDDAGRLDAMLGVV